MVNLCFCPQYSAHVIVTCLAKMNGVNFYFVAAYFYGKIPKIPDELLLLVDSRGNSEVIIGVDSSAHSSLWGWDITDKRGELVEDIMATYDL